MAKYKQGRQVHVKFDADTWKRFDAVKTLLGAASASDVFRRGLHLLDVVVHGCAEGGTFVMRRKDGQETEIVVL